MEAADEIQKETIIKDDDVALGNGDVSSSADLSLEEPSPGLHFRIIMNQYSNINYLKILL